MRSKFFKLLISLLFLSFLTCNSSDNVSDSVVTDDYSFLVVDNLGKVYEVGNNTGNIEQTATINKQIDGTFLYLGAIAASNEKIYALEYFYDPGPTNNLLVFDKLTGTTDMVLLEIPNNIVGDENAIIALATYGTNLIAVVTENALMDNTNKHLVLINTDTYELEDLGVSFNEDAITSMITVGNRVYISTANEGLVEINLNTNSVDNVEFSGTTINGGKLAVIDTNRLALMQFILGNNIANDFKLIELDLTNYTYTDGSIETPYGYANPAGTSIYKNGEYINLFSSSNLEIYYGILKRNFDGNSLERVTIKSNDLNRNMIILGTVE